jgi:hypothetical protein
MSDTGHWAVRVRDGKPVGIRSTRAFLDAELIPPRDGDVTVEVVPAEQLRGAAEAVNEAMDILGEPGKPEGERIGAAYLVLGALLADFAGQ